MTEASASVESSGGSGGESIEEGSTDPTDSNDDGPGQDPSKSENAEERKGPRQEQGNSNRRNNRSSRNLKSQVLKIIRKSRKFVKRERLRFIQNPWPNLDSIRSKLLFSIHFLFRSRIVCYPWGQII